MGGAKISEDATKLDRITALWELMHRDPLGQELTDVLLQLSAEKIPQHERSALIDRRIEYEAKLCQKYGVHHLYIPEPMLQGAAQRYADAGVRCWFLPGHEALVSATINWVPPDTVQFGPSGVETPDSHPIPPGQPPLLTIQIDLSKVNQHDLERIASAVKERVRQALRSLPPDVAADHSPDIPALKFLRARSKKGFYQDLRRYDLHTGYGLSYRLIAFLETQELKGYPMPATPQRRRVGRSVPGDDAVERSVKRIYRAIHRKTYQARRRRLDAPAHDRAPYYCPTHGNECPDMTCPHLQRWWTQIMPSLPTDGTGRGPFLSLQDE
jgi:hypothetical protein